jgi:hypothetical protein
MRIVGIYFKDVRKYGRFSMAKQLITSNVKGFRAKDGEKKDKKKNVPVSESMRNDKPKK